MNGKKESNKRDEMMEQKMLNRKPAPPVNRHYALDPSPSRFIIECVPFVRTQNPKISFYSQQSAHRNVSIYSQANALSMYLAFDYDLRLFFLS